MDRRKRDTTSNTTPLNNTHSDTTHRTPQYKTPHNTQQHPKQQSRHSDSPRQSEARRVDGGDQGIRQDLVTEQPALSEERSWVKRREEGREKKNKDEIEIKIE